MCTAREFTLPYRACKPRKFKVPRTETAELPEYDNPNLVAVRLTRTALSHVGHYDFDVSFVLDQVTWMLRFQRHWKKDCLKVGPTSRLSKDCRIATLLAWT